MEIEQILEKVKQNMLITGNFHDKLLTNYILEVQQFLKDAGVNEDIVNSAEAIGIVSRGVLDLWNYGSGQANLSEYFMQRATQLALINEEGDETHE